MGLAIDHQANGVRLLQLSSHLDSRGGLTVIEEGAEAPFPFKRVYFIYDVPPASSRAGHAHRTSQNMLIAVAGSFDVHVEDGFQRASYRLERRSHGLIIPAWTWLQLDNFSPGAVCLTVSSHPFHEDDRWTDYDDFRRAVGALR